MTSFTVEVTSSKVMARLDAMPATVRLLLRDVIVRDTNQLLATVRQNLSGTVLNRRTGKLYASIKQQLTEQATSIEGRVYSDGSVPYAAIHEFGGTTSPHVILPKTASVLAFQMGGKTVFAKSVNHPGSKIPERSYMRSALTAMRDKIIEDMRYAVTLAARTA